MALQQSSAAVGGSVGTLPQPVLLHEAPRPVETAHHQGEEAVKDVVCGSAAGVIGKYIEYPFDTVKKTFKQDGLYGLYRGISAPLFGAAVETSCLFFSYRLAGDALRASVPSLRNNPEKELPYHYMLTCGMAAGAFTSVFLTPIELVKCKMQVPLEAGNIAIARPGILSIIGSIYRHQGVTGFWHGQMGTFIRETGGGAAWFGGYEGVKALFKNMDGTPSAPASDDDLSIYQRMASGSVAGMAYNFMFYPADTVKSRMQTEDVKRLTGGKSTFMAVFKAIWKENGLKGMYRGCGITVARSIPSSAFIFTVYEELKKRWPERRSE